MDKILFIDRDGTLVVESPIDYQLDSLEKLSFLPEVFYYLKKIVLEFDYKLVMVTNQDGLGTDSFPEHTFWPAHNKVIEAFKNEGIRFYDVHIDPSFPSDNSPNRKPNTGMLTSYLNGNYDIKNSIVIGDRASDIQLAENLNCSGILIDPTNSVDCTSTALKLNTTNWESIYNFLKSSERKLKSQRTTKETDIHIDLNLDGKGVSIINTGLEFYNHMLEQISKHGEIDLTITSTGDLEIDEHHTIEDTAITLGKTFKKALGNKMGIERYGFCLPMDDCLAQVALDFGGRAWLEWDVEFKRERIGDVPTEMFHHFFKSFSDGAECNLNIKAEGANEHHKIEAIFKAFAKSIKMAIKRDTNSMNLPSTKGVL